MSEQKASTNKATEEGKACAALAYLLFGIIWYFADDKMKKNTFVNFHVKQALVLIIVSMVGSLALGMSFILAWLIPFLQVAVFVFIVTGIMNAINGVKKELPLVGQFGKKFKF